MRIEAIDGYLRHLQLCTADLAMIDEDAIQERLFRWRDLAAPALPVRRRAMRDYARR